MSDKTLKAGCISRCYYVYSIKFNRISVSATYISSTTLNYRAIILKLKYIVYTPFTSAFIVCPEQACGYHKQPSTLLLRPSVDLFKLSLNDHPFIFKVHNLHTTLHPTSTVIHLACNLTLLLL